MKRLNFIYLSLVLIAGVSVGQAQPIAEVSDNTCTEWTAANCSDATSQGCNSTTFTLQSAQTVRLYAYIACENGNDCPYCLSVAYIYRPTGGTYVACVHTLCDARCSSNYADVALDRGDYILYSCKIDCDEQDPCDNCPTTCTATARVFSMPEP